VKQQGKYHLVVVGFMSLLAIGSPSVVANSAPSGSAALDNCTLDASRLLSAK
jgi:hypothetical protein